MLKRPLFGVGIVLLLIFAGVLIFNIPWGGNVERVAQDIQLSDKLIDYADTNVKARMTTSGEITSNSLHREIVVTVGRDSVVAQVIRGYEGEVIRSTRQSNNEDAYRVFLAGLKAAEFVDTQTSLSSNYLGACPLDRRYYFELYSSSKAILESWATSCDTSDGTFSGQLSTVRKLFERQVNDYNEFTKGVDL